MADAEGLCSGRLSPTLRLQNPMSIIPKVVPMALTLLVTQVVVALVTAGKVDQRPPQLPASRSCFSFEASFATDFTSMPAPIDAAWKVHGACFDGQWYMTVDSPEERWPCIACDGVRVFRCAANALLIDPLSQRAVPMQLWSIAALLQLGSELYGERSAGGTTRWTCTQGGATIACIDPDTNVAQYMYEWRNDKGALQNRITHAIERDVGGPFYRGGTEEIFSEDASQQRVRSSWSQMLIEGEVRVGETRLGKSFVSHAWSYGPEGRPVGGGEPPLRVTRTGRLESCSTLEQAEFGRKMGSLTSLSRGMEVLDRTRSAVLRFVVGDSFVVFDGVGYQCSTALHALPTDLELVQLLRTATLLDPSAQSKQRSAHASPFVRPLSSQATSGVSVSVPAPVLALGLAIEPGRTLDLGMVQFGETPTQRDASFHLRNTTDHARVIKSVRASCGCMKTKASLTTIAPGATATIATTLTVERSKTYHSSIWVVFEDGQIEELKVVAVGVPENAVRATAFKADSTGDVLTIVLYSSSGKPEGEVNIPLGAESTIASDSGWQPIGAASDAKHWIRDIVRKP